MAAAKKSPRKKSSAKKTNRWSARVNATSNAMDIAPNTFTAADPKKIARAVERDAEASTRRKTTPYRSAMSMLTFYINRAGKNLSPKQRKVLEEAKEVLRAEFGRAAKTKTARSASALRAERSLELIEKTTLTCDDLLAGRRQIEPAGPVDLGEGANAA